MTDPTVNGTDGYTNFMVTFDPDHESQSRRLDVASGITNFTGTFSYIVAPDNGKGNADSYQHADLVMGQRREASTGHHAGSDHPDPPSGQVVDPNAQVSRTCRSRRGARGGSVHRL